MVIEAGSSQRKKKSKIIIVPGAEQNKERFPTMSGFLRSFSDHGLNMESSKAKLGTLIGVFLPSIQNVFGVLMFLRMPWCVGMMGIPQAFLMVFSCCFITFTACTSLSAVVTNGKTGRGGPYFLISRSLGPAVGSAIGILLCMANTIAVAMYVIGGLEIFLISLVPAIIIGKGDTDTIISDTEFLGQMTNNYRLYGVAMAFIVFLVVIIGVRFTQLFAPVSLACVIVSILSLYAGAIEKSIRPGGPFLCLLGDALLREDAILGSLKGSVDLTNLCRFCIKNSSLPLFNVFCNITVGNGTNVTNCAPEWNDNDLTCERAFPGFSSVIENNLHASYLAVKQTTAGSLPSVKGAEVIQDLSTSFFVCLAIYFPSVTGIKTGANMSGDLKKPQKAIPQGTLAAHLVTTFVYLTYVVIFGAVTHRALLQDKFGTSLGGSMPISHLAWPHYLVVVIGAFTSTFGAAIQSLCAAPKLLQSIAEDDVIPFLRPFAKTCRNEPFWGQLLLFGISLIFILIARLDVVAPFVTQCFLTTYAALNLSCAVCSFVGFPSWRPRYRCYNMYISFLGFLLSLFFMFANKWIYALFSTVTGLLIYIYVVLRGNRKEYGDSLGGLQASLAQFALVGHKYKPKTRHADWNPRMLVLNRLTAHENPNEYRRLLWAAYQLSHASRRKFSVISTLLHTDPSTYQCRVKLNQERKKIKQAIDDVHLKGYAKPIVCNRDYPFGHAVSSIFLGCTLGQLRPNALMLSFPSTNNEDISFWQQIHQDSFNDMALLVAKGDFPCLCTKSKPGHIDVWWIINDGDLLLMLSLLVKRLKLWKKCTLRLYMVLETGDECEKIEEPVKKCLNLLKLKTVHLETVLLPYNKIRTFAYCRNLKKRRRWEELKNAGLTQLTAERQVQLTADIHVCSAANIDTEEEIYDMPQVLEMAQLLNERIREKSESSDLVIMNFPLAPKTPTTETMGRYVNYLNSLCSGLERVLLIRGSGKELVKKHK